MDGEVFNEAVKRAIIRKAIRLGCKQTGDLVKYGYNYYWVDIANDQVVLQRVLK